MSDSPTSLRPYTQMSWGGACQFRGLIQTDSQSLSNRTIVNRGTIGTVVYRGGVVKSNFVITGVSRDSSGNPLGGCRMELFITGGDTPQQTIISDISGNFSFWNPGTGPFYIVAYKATAPDVAGTTVNTLIPAAI